MELKNVPIAIGVLVLFLTIPAAVYLSSRPQAVRTLTKAGKEESAVFYLWPAETTVATGAETEVRLTLASPEETASEATAIVKYDPTALDISNLEKGIIFNNYLKKKINTVRGEIEVQARGEFQGTGTLATITFKPRERGETQLTLIKSGSEILNRKGSNILQGVNGSLIVSE